MSWFQWAFALGRDTRGSVALYMALGTVVFLPIAAISIELSSLMALHTETKQAAEAAALAAARHLNFTEAGLEAAETAARESVANTQRLAADDSAVIGIATVQFLWALPPAPQTNYGLYETTNANEARYVRVITEPQQHVSVLMAAFLSIWTEDGTAAATNIAAAQAIAGRTAVACRTLPLMMCNPAEPGSAIAQAAGGFNKFGDFLRANPRYTRAQFRIKWIGPNASFGPGAFGLLEPTISEKNGAKGVEDELALNTPSFCVPLDAAKLDPDIKTGQAATIADGLNVRFDIYENNWKNDKNSADYSPAPDVVKSYKPGNGAQGACKADIVAPSAQYQPLPLDPCFYNPSAGNCFSYAAFDSYSPMYGANNGFGNNAHATNLLKYFQVNHPKDVQGGAIKSSIWNELVAKEAAVYSEIGMPLPPAPTQTSPMSRYTIYRWEIDKANNIPGTQTQQGGLPKEEGRPQCSTNNVGTQDRRLLYIAVVNCQQHAAAIAAHGTVPVVEFAEGFITQPAAKGSGADKDKGAIMVEIRRTIEQGSSSNIVLRDVVQLY